MAIDFTKTISEALATVEFTGACQEFLIYPQKVERNIHNTDVLLETYGRAKWAIVDLLNQNYSTIIENHFDLYHWLHNRTDDEVAYFLNEAGSNCLNYSEYKIPSKFQAWMGKKGFILGIEQKGAGFDAYHIFTHNIQQNTGQAFQFFRSCQSTIFFDDPVNAKAVFMMFLLE